MKLTLFAIQNAKPKDKMYRLSDGDGLALQVEANGSKLWRFRYRFAGKANMLTFGAFPEVPLAIARQKRNEVRALIAEGIDPSKQRRDDKRAAVTAEQNTFASVAADYIETLKEKGSAAITIWKNRWLLEELAKPIAQRPITAITSAELLDLLKRIEKSGRRETARRLRGTIGSVFRHAISTLRATNDPTYALRGSLVPPNVKHRAAITDERRLGQFMVAIDTYDARWPTVRLSMLFLALTMVRPGEVRHMRRSEVIFPRALWKIPAERMKMRRPFEVPLSKQALAILREAWPLSEGHELVFPAPSSPSKLLSENAMNAALRIMGFAKDEMTAHGFRSSASTILNERGYDKDHIEAALAHQDEDDVRRAYNRSAYLPQRAVLMQEWANLLDQFREQSRTAQAAP